MPANDAPMERALTLAKQAIGSTSPNPPVGAVLLQGGVVIGEGFTQPPNRPHAEVMALRQAGPRARGATLYVTLEPCSHHGRTPPCSKALVDAGVTQVHMAILDPNPLVAGQGRAELEAAGIRTFIGEGEADTQRLYESYTHYITTKRPFVIAKYAMSLDGKIATTTGHSQWITGQTARQYSNQLRGMYDAIMVGIGTVLADDPRLTYRDIAGFPHQLQPLRIIVDSRGRTPASAHLLSQPGRTLVATALPPGSGTNRLRQTDAEVLTLSGDDGKVDLAALLDNLGQQEITSVIVEGGSTLMGSLFDLRLVDKILALIAPIIVGGKEAPSPVGGIGVRNIAEVLALRDVRTEPLGRDVLITGYCRRE